MLHKIYHIIKSLYFNFHFLPFTQAIKIPIIVHNVNLVKGDGSIYIDTDNIQYGMIHLGKYRNELFPNDGVTWNQLGGKVIFKGHATIGNHCFITIGKNSTVVFGDDFRCNAGLKMASYFGVTFGKSNRIGWDCLIMDTNMHPLFDMEKERFKKASGPINIGDYNWFGTRCRIMHSVSTPERCIFGMNTTVTRNAVAESYCVMGGDPVRVLTRNVMRVYGQDQEDLN